jgi:hypothetical protein
MKLAIEDLDVQPSGFLCALREDAIWILDANASDMPEIGSQAGGLRQTIKRKGTTTPDGYSVELQAMDIHYKSLRSASSIVRTILGSACSSQVRVAER